MRIAFGADDDNECVRAVLDYLHTVAEVRTYSDNVDWPDFAKAVGQAVAGGECAVGVVMCWTGTGTTIAANQVPGVRAALAWEPWIANGARLWNDANVLGLSLKRTAPDVAVDCVKAFLDTTEFDPDEATNIDKIRT